MLKWIAPLKVKDSLENQNDSHGITEDPLATISFHKQQNIYAVSRINPLYLEDNKYWNHQNISHPHSKCIKQRSSSPSNMVSSLKKSVSSGYGGSQGDSSNCPNDVKLQEDATVILEQNGNYVRSLKIATQERNRRRVSRFSSSYMSGSSVAGTLTTIPEGKVDSTIPKPIWPKVDLHNDICHPLVDETMLLYTSSSLTHSRGMHLAAGEQSVKDILIDLLSGIDATIQGKGSTAEEMLKRVNEKILLSIEVLKNCTEEEMRKLCVSLSNSKNVLSVIRAFGNSSSNSTSGNSTQSCPEWSSSREHPVCSETDEIYQIPSSSSSSGFSDSFKQLDINQLPVFVHEDISNVPNGLRNAMIYGTLYRGNYKPSPEKDKWAIKQKKGLLQACNDNKPSVWEQYYGVNILPDGTKMAYSSNPTDIPLYPGGRPEADFTLDVPRSEFLTKRLKADKKWRCRCRILTSFFGLVFFLLSVMAVSLLLTRGKRMFGSMV